MTRYRRILSIITAGLLGLMSACSKADQEPIHTSTPEQETSVETIQIDALLEDLPEEIVQELRPSKSRLAFVDKGEGKGLKFDFAKNEELELYTYWTQGSTKAVGKMAKLKIISDKPLSNGRWEAKTKVEVPSNIKLKSSTPIYVSGAIGVSGIDNSGKATVPSSGAMFAKINKYVVPMYFGKTPIQGDRLEPTFELYGSYLAIQLSNNSPNGYTQAYQPRELSFRTAAFTTEGTMDLAGEGYPAWSSKQTATTEQIVRIEQGVVPANEARSFFVWVKPRIKTGRAKLVTEVRSHITTEEENDYGTAQSDWNYPVLGMRPIQEKEVYRLDVVSTPPPGGLIITELFGGKEAYTVAWELYNSSDKRIDLYDYSFRNSKNGETELISDKHRLMYQKGYPEVKIGGKVEKMSRTKGRFFLEPKQMAVFLDPSVTITYKQLPKNPNLRWMFQIWSNDPKRAPGFLTPEGSWNAVINNKEKRGQIEDAFFRFSDGSSPYIDLNATYMRKPFRNVPRPYMEIGRVNTDWVTRKRSESSDWGYRFGYEWTGSSEPKWLGKRYGVKMPNLGSIAPDPENGYYGSRTLLQLRKQDIYTKTRKPHQWKGMKEYKLPRAWVGNTVH